ncbi:MAG TPA: hypothetical protein DEQ85_10555, partial [Clostridiales bacterium]|nr:hypothetical protein [Clostridiales bacterium]
MQFIFGSTGIVKPDTVGVSRGENRFFAAGCGSEAFLLPSVAAGASFNWQYPASLVDSTPRFLSAKRSAVSSLREEVAQRNPLEGV